MKAKYIGSRRTYLDSVMGMEISTQSKGEHILVMNYDSLNIVVRINTYFMIWMEKMFLFKNSKSEGYVEELEKNRTI